MIIVLNKYKILTLVVAMTLMLPVALQGAQAIEVGMLIEGFGLEQQVTKAQIDEPEKEEKAAEKQAKIAEKAAEKAKENGQSLGICDTDNDGIVNSPEMANEANGRYGTNLNSDFFVGAIQHITNYTDSILDSRAETERFEIDVRLKIIDLEGEENDVFYECPL